MDFIRVSKKLDYINNFLGERKVFSNLSIIFIAHDLSVVKHISNRVGVMYLGELVEINETKDIFPAYKKALEREDGKSTIVVEYGDYYNEK